MAFSVHGNRPSVQLESLLESMVRADHDVHPAYSAKILVAVAILAILRSKTNAFKPSTVVVEQFRPPVAKFVVGE